MAQKAASEESVVSTRTKNQSDCKLTETEPVQSPVRLELRPWWPAFVAGRGRRETRRQPRELWFPDKLARHLAKRPLQRQRLELRPWWPAFVAARLERDPAPLRSRAAGGVQ
jgi:hypothetical protein